MILKFVLSKDQFVLTVRNDDYLDKSNALLTTNANFLH